MVNVFEFISAATNSYSQLYQLIIRITGWKAITELAYSKFQILKL